MTKKTILLTGFIIAKFLLQYSLISPDYDLQRDEYLHLDQAHHLAWGYLSVPPVTSWISYLIFILGNSVFWIKFFPALFGALTILVVWKTIEELNGNLFALALGATGVLLSALLRINTLFQPNSMDVLCWTSLYFIFIKWIRTKEDRWLYDPLPQDFADMLGWKELAVKVDSVLNTLPHPDQTFLLCDNYGQAGAINYYSKNKTIRANSFSADYINWINLDKKIKDGVFVMEEVDEDNTDAFQLFDTVYLAAKRINPYAREQEISIYVLLGAKVDVRERIREEVSSQQ